MAVRGRRTGDNVCDIRLERLRRRRRGILPLRPRLRGRGIVVEFPRRQAWRAGGGAPDFDPAS